MSEVVTEYSGSGDPARSIELLWGTQDVTKRGPKPRLTVARVAQVAIALADAEGLAALSMRRVAEQLGVGTMSLYTYVPSKAELIDVMLDTVYAEPVSPPGADEGWRPRLERIARENWAQYRRHPWMLQVSQSSRPVMGPNLIAKYDHELRAVDGIGLSDVEMDSVVGLLSGYVDSAARRAVDAVQVEQRSGISDEQWWETYAPLLEKVMTDDRFPVASRVGQAAGQTYNGAIDPEHAFEFGLQRVLDGIEVLVESRR